MFLGLDVLSSTLWATQSGLMRFRMQLSSSKAQEAANTIRSPEGFETGSPIFLHFEDRWDTIL